MKNVPATDEQIRAALERYDLQLASYTVLRDFGNTVLHAKLEDREYGVRLCAQDVERGHLEAELDWLEALRRDTGLIVPRAVPNRDGERIGTLEDRMVVVFDWVQGQPIPDMNFETARAVGRLAAALHDHARGYRPVGFAGHRVDLAWLRGPESWWATQASHDLGANFARLEPCIAFTASVMERLGTQPEHFGLIHTDLHFGNILVHDGGYRGIDFGDCALGHYHFDLGVTEAELMDFDDGPELIGAFRSSYQEARGVRLEPGDLAAFRIAGSLAFLEWVFTSPNQRVREDKLRWVPSVVQSMLKAGEWA